ncbi:TIGR01777 family oxidoreductase, partial [Otariodibacter sp.]|uniref:TIGR01777 family oxidoreductase n=1 Tax=Otariodibacter sp. TaxID=3030919 RepID=UPI002631E5F6
KWTKKQKGILRVSRINITQQLVNLIKKSEHPPHTFISGSATGFYGDLPKAPIAKYYDEQTACGNQFAAQLCEEWENTALEANSEKTRVCIIRTGIVLNREGGALKRMLPLYKLGLGGKLAKGLQYWAWISLEDHIDAILFLLNNSNSKGAYNFVAPKPITNAEFNRILSRTVKRPAFFNIPEIILKMILGERSQLLLDNQPLIPQKLLDEGFVFKDSKLSETVFL